MKRARPHVKHSLHPGDVLVGHGGTITIGLPSLGRLEVSVAETRKRGVVQIHLLAFNAIGDPLGHDEIGGVRLPTLAWCYLNTSTGQMTQEVPA